MCDMGDLKNLQPVGQGGAADLAFPCQLRHIQHASALPQQQFKEAQEGGPFLQPEQFLHITREIGVEPFTVELRIGFLRQQRGWQTTAQQPVPQIDDSKGGQLLVENRYESHNPFAARETVAKLLCRRERG